MIPVGFAGIEQQLLIWMLAMIRPGAAFLAAPIFGAPQVPVQVRLVPLHAPVQPEKMPLPFFAVKVTKVWGATDMVQAPGQRMTLVELVTCPSPATVTVTG